MSPKTRFKIERPEAAEYSQNESRSRKTSLRWDDGRVTKGDEGVERVQESVTGEH